MTDDPKHPLDEKRLEAFNVVPIKKPSKWREAVRKSNDKPASGNKARGGPPSGMPAAGPGWGGSAKGEGKDLSDMASHITPAEARERAANKAELAEEALGHMVSIMRESEFEGNRLNAASKVRAEIVGNPMQRVMSASTTPEHLVDQAQIDALTPEQKDALRDIANALLERREGPAVAEGGT